MSALSGHIFPARRTGPSANLSEHLCWGGTNNDLGWYVYGCPEVAPKLSFQTRFENKSLRYITCSLASFHSIALLRNMI